MTKVRTVTSCHYSINVGTLVISGILMFLAKGRVIDDTVQDVLEQSKRYVDTMVDSGALATNADEFGRIYDDDHYAHTQFWSIDIPEFAELRKYIVAATAEAIAKTMPQAVADLLEEMRSDVYLFYRRLILSNSADNRYYDKPILAHISPEEFVDALLSLHRSGWPTVTRALRERYDHIDFARSLASELPWLDAIRRILGLRLDGLAGTLDEFRIRKLIEYLEESMTKLGKALPPEPGE